MSALQRIVAAMAAYAIALKASAERKLGEAILSGVRMAAAFAPGLRITERLGIAGWYDCEYIAPDGAVRRWSFPNLVTTTGKNHLLDTEMAGSAYTASWYMLLIGITGYTGVAAGDTMSSHAGWTESTVYSNATRPSVSWNAASGGSKASTTTTFNINASDTIKGVGLTTVSTKGGTTGTLYSAGLFSGGDQAVSSGGTLNVTYTASA